VLHSERFVDLALAEVWATLLDEGVYLGSQSTFYRLLRAGEREPVNVAAKPPTRRRSNPSWSPAGPTRCTRGISSATRRC